MASPGVGDKAPELELAGTGGKTYRLSDYAGQPVVLVFYPGDNTPVCTTQLNTYNDDLADFEELGAQVLALSPQSVESHEDFSCRQGGFRFPLLADTDKSVGRLYGIASATGRTRGLPSMRIRSLVELTLKRSTVKFCSDSCTPGIDRTWRRIQSM